MTSRPTSRAALALTAATSAFVLAAASGAPALAATSPVGTGTSSVQVLSLTAGGHTLLLGGLSLVSDTVGGSQLARVTVTPLVVDGTSYGEQVVTPVDSPLSVPAQTTPGALAGLISLTSPAFAATASGAPATHVGTSSLGDISLLGFPVPLTGGMSLGSAVTSGSASAQKSINIRNLALPSIGAILAQLGLDVSKLPAGTLGTLVDQLDLVNDAIAAAQGAIDTAQAEAASATATASSAALALTQATATQTASQSTLDSATAALQALLDQVTGATLIAFPGANTLAGYAALGAPGLAAVELLVPGTADAFTAYTAAQAALTAASAAVASAQAALDAAQAALALVVATLNTALGVVDDLASAVLDDTPLVSLDSVRISSLALSTSNVVGGQTAEVTGGTIDGLRVLGTDVLDAVLGSSSLDVVDLVGDNAAVVTDAIDALTGTLSSVLSSVPGFALDIPAPTVDLLTKTTSTSISGGFGRALASVQALKVTLPSVTIPSALALPGAADLPALQGVTQVAGALTSAPIILELATLSDQSAFAPSLVAAPGTVPGSNPDLAATGMPVGVAGFALLLTLAALSLRRRALRG